MSCGCSGAATSAGRAPAPGDGGHDDEQLAEADEIARLAVFAASAHGTYLSGANITVDGASTPTVV